MLIEAGVPVQLLAGGTDGNDSLWKHLNIQTRHINLCRFAGWNSNCGKEPNNEQFPSMEALNAS